ncbi:MAG: amino acid adenylation domain-containing protein [Cyanobacteria bacterium J06634_5]
MVTTRQPELERFESLAEQVLDLVCSRAEEAHHLGSATGQLALHRLVEVQAAKSPGAIALVHQGQQLTYQTLNQRANQLAHYLMSLGIGCGQLVAISLMRSPEMVIAFLGVLKAGAAYVPIDPNYPALRRQYILADAQAQMMVTSAEVANAEMTSANDSLRLICLDTDAKQLLRQPTHNPDLEISPEQLAYVIYTSGSTGNPKGVMAHHLGLVNYSLALAEALSLTAGDRMLQFSTMSFDFIVSEIYPTLAVGGTLVLRSDGMATSTKAFVDFIAETSVSVIQFTTAFWHELVSGIDKQGLTLPKSLRLVLFGGEKASLALCQRWLTTVGDYPQLFNAYGPTEATVITTLYDVGAEGYDGREDLPIGRAVRNAQTYVLDDALKPVAPGDAGELYIGGPGVTCGYLNLPEKTEAAFISSPFYSGERLYKTGDLVKMDEGGLIRFVGRVDFQVKIRGFRIELGEIESRLESYPQIQHRIVVAREDTPGDKRLVAYVVTHDGQPLDRADLKTFLSAQLPAFMMPAAIVVLPELPKNANGKIDRKALPLPSQADTQRFFVGARSPLEEKLVGLWESVLGISPIGITDNFFELGGHSLLVMRLFSELEATFDQRLPLVEIFAAPTIEQMAERLGRVLADAQKETAIKTEKADSTLVSLRLDEACHEPADDASGEPSTEAPKTTSPLFLIYDADGETGLYIHLARQLTGGRAVYAIGPKGDAVNRLLHSRIREMAQHCVAQMRSVQPRGPYFLSGLCSGGVIAFEAALQLEQAGEQVVLALLDSPAPTLENREGSMTEARQAGLEEVLASKDLGHIVRKVWQKGVNVASYEVTSRTKKTVAFARCHAFRWWQDQRWPLPKPLQGLPVRELVTFAFEGYRPSQQLAGPMMLVRATEGNGVKADRPYFPRCGDPLLGWEPCTQQQIRVRDVDGGHSTMLSDTHSHSSAAVLDAFMDEASP